MSDTVADKPSFRGELEETVDETEGHSDDDDDGGDERNNSLRR